MVGGVTGAPGMSSPALRCALEDAALRSLLAEVLDVMAAPLRQAAGRCDDSMCS